MGSKWLSYSCQDYNFQCRSDDVFSPCLSFPSKSRIQGGENKGINEKTNHQRQDECNIMVPVLYYEN